MFIEWTKYEELLLQINLLKLLNENQKFYFGVFLLQFFNDFISSFKITYFVEKNFILLIVLLPFFLFKKEMEFKISK